MDDAEFARMRAEMQHERETRRREITVRRPDVRDSTYSGGVVIDIPLGNMSTCIDLNPAELRAWAEQMLAFADEIERSMS